MICVKSVIKITKLQNICFLQQYTVQKVKKYFYKWIIIIKNINNIIYNNWKQLSKEGFIKWIYKQQGMDIKILTKFLFQNFNPIF